MSDRPDEYVRFEMKVQRGDGPDRRGDVRVELQREISGDGDTVPTEVESTEGIETATEFQPHHSAFAEFAFETERATDLLCGRLGLDDNGDSDA